MQKVICVCGNIPRYIWHTIDEKKPADYVNNPPIRSIICDKCHRYALGSFRSKEKITQIETMNEETGKLETKYIKEQYPSINQQGKLRYNHNDTTRRWNSKITKLRKVMFPDGLVDSRAERK